MLALGEDEVSEYLQEWKWHDDDDDDDDTAASWPVQNDHSH